MEFFYFLFLLILIFEVSLNFLSKKIKKKFSWLINKSDLYPYFDKERFLFFKKFRFNYNLGWQNKPGFKNYDKVNKKKINYSIDKRGFRNKYKKNKKELIASFGDSYVFCRQVKDNETWQEQLTKNKNFCILNYGEGNYGLDQSLIKYSNTKFKRDTKYIIQGFVPETISRIQSEWKHFIEFGNIHAFKPKFEIIKRKLILKKNPISRKTKIKDLPRVINNIKNSDRFYKEKFLKHTLQFPYILNFFKNLKFNLKIFLIFFLENKKNLKDKLFEIVVQNNLRMSHIRYNEEYSKNLMNKILEKFIQVAKRKGQKPIIIIFPQLFDLKLKKTVKFVNKYFDDFDKDVYVINLIKKLNKYDTKKLYINDQYGGHFSKYGNKVAANIIDREIRNIINK